MGVLLAAGGKWLTPRPDAVSEMWRSDHRAGTVSGVAMLFRVHTVAVTFLITNLVSLRCSDALKTPYRTVAVTFCSESGALNIIWYRIIMAMVVLNITTEWRAGGAGARAGESIPRIWLIWFRKNKYLMGLSLYLYLCLINNHTWKDTAICMLCMWV